MAATEMSNPVQDGAVRHLHTERAGLAERTGTIAEFAPDDKLDVEQRWLRRGAAVLRLPLI